MKLSKMFAASIVGSLSANSWAVDPQSINLGGFQFTPTLEVSEAYDDNYRGFHDNEQSSWVTTISPTFLLTAETRNTGYQLEYNLNQEIYHSDSDATNADHHLVFRNALEFNSRNRLRWDLQYHRIEDTADDDFNEEFDDDLTVSQGNNPDNENDKYSRAIASAVYSFGTIGGLNQLDFGANYEQRRYHNSDGINDDLDRDSLMLNTIWYHRLGARTRTLLELRHTDHDYKEGGDNNRDATDIAVLGGATWDATAKTTGSLKLGAEKKNFDSSGRDDYTTPMWEVGVDWKPRTYSTVSVKSRRAFDEGDSGASTIQNMTNLVSWTHEWSPFISTELEYRLSNRDYKSTDREDDLSSYMAGVTYSPDRWVDFTLGYRRLDNDSNVNEESYERNIYQLSVQLSL